MALQLSLPPKGGVHKRSKLVGATGRYKICVAGMGGSGTHLLACLEQIDQALAAYGLPRLDVIVYDPDVVERSNTVRSLFLEHEVGLNKAIAAVHRTNTTQNLAWSAVPKRFRDAGFEYDFLITCVDTGRARQEINDICCGMVNPPHYWLDMGNGIQDDNEVAQYWLGEFPRHGKSNPNRLITIVEKYPTYYNGTEPESNLPSCSRMESIEKQGLFANKTVATKASQLLWILLSKGVIHFQGQWLNLTDGRDLPIDIPAEKEAKAAA